MRLRYPFLSLVSLIMLSVLIGCSGSSMQPNTGSTTVTASLAASPSSVATGSQATLTWSTTNATSVSISPGIGTVAASGTQTVSPTQTTTYTLTAIGGDQTVTRAATVTVTTQPTAQFSASPTTIQSGQSTTLTWSTTNADSVSISPGIGTVATSGTKTVSPTQTTTYTLTATGAGQTITKTADVTVTSGVPTALTGIMEWKNGTTGNGLYDQETTLTPANVNPSQFGEVRKLHVDGELLAQFLYVRNVNLGAQGVHDLLLVATEHDSVYAFDGNGTSTTPLWHRNFVDDANGGNTNCTGANCVTTQADDHGGRSTFGGEIGITGTPVVDPKTGILYVVAATQLTTGQNGTVTVTVTDTLHAIDIRTGKDANGGSVVINASVPGTSEGTIAGTGKIPFDPTQENQRPGLVIVNGVLYIAYGSFSDYPPYHGWLFAYDPTTLQQLGVFNSSPTYQADYYKGGGSAYWAGGASPSFETDGSFYVVAANGSTTVQNGGDDYGDSVMHMSFANGKFKVLDWFTPFNRDCIDATDIEIGSGGVTLLPDNVGGGRKLAVVLTKEGRLYLLDRANLGHFNATKDQVVQQFMVGADVCDASTKSSAADGAGWERLYGNASYWNGNLYMAASNAPIHQYSISGGVIDPTSAASHAGSKATTYYRGGVIDTAPAALGVDSKATTYYRGNVIAPTPAAIGVGATAATHNRGGNTVVSANGNTNGIVWMYAKEQSGNAILHAYNALNVGVELWNSEMDASRDALNTGGEGFQIPIIIDGKVFASSGKSINEYTLLQ